MGYTSWAFASFTIVLRVKVTSCTGRAHCISSFFFFFRITLWNRNIIVSLIAVGVWLGAVAMNIRRMFVSPLLYTIISYLLHTLARM